MLMRKSSEAARAARKAQETLAANELDHDVVDQLKQLAIACRLYNNDHANVMPTNLAQISPFFKDVRPNGNLELFEFVQYDRQITMN